MEIARDDDDQHRSSQHAAYRLHRRQAISERSRHARAVSVRIAPTVYLSVCLCVAGCRRRRLISHRHTAVLSLYDSHSRHAATHRQLMQSHRQLITNGVVPRLYTARIGGVSSPRWRRTYIFHAQHHTVFRRRHKFPEPVGLPSWTLMSDALRIDSYILSP